MSASQYKKSDCDAGGKEGVDRSLEILQTQMTRTMKLLGARTLEELKPEHVSFIQKFKS